MGSSTTTGNAVVRSAFWLALFAATCSVYVRDGRHTLQVREAHVAKMKAAAKASTPPPAKRDAAAATSSAKGGDEEFDDFDEGNTAAASPTPPLTGDVVRPARVHVQFCVG
jgi:hypothetical protein